MGLARRELTNDECRVLGAFFDAEVRAQRRKDALSRYKKERIMARSHTNEEVFRSGTWIYSNPAPIDMVNAGFPVEMLCTFDGRFYRIYVDSAKETVYRPFAIAEPK